MGVSECGYSPTRPTTNELLRMVNLPSRNGGHWYELSSLCSLEKTETPAVFTQTASDYSKAMNLATSSEVLMPSDVVDKGKLESCHNTSQSCLNSIMIGSKNNSAITNPNQNTATHKNNFMISEAANSPYLVGYRSISAIPRPLETHLSYFYTRRVETRRTAINKTLREVVQIAQELLHEVELQEPRFISTLKLVHPKSQQQQQQQQHHHQQHHQPVGDYAGKGASQQVAGYYDGLRVLSPTRFEVILFLNQMGVFNFVDDGSVPGGAVLKLSDGRKRSMSLWVEFITASGYLSARKIRARFHSLVGQAVQKCSYRGILRMMGQTSEVRICIRERYILQITPAFRCSGLWPRSAGHWPPSVPSPANAMPPRGLWPTHQLASEVKMEGFCLLSQESVYTKDKQSSAEGDAWLLDFYEAEERLLAGSSRRQCFSILKTLADQHLTGAAAMSNAGHSQFTTDGDPNGPEPTIQAYDLKTLVLHECEKHPRDDEWILEALPDRINGVLLQLISCLQHRRCPHYFMPHLDIFRGNSTIGMDLTARQAWCLLRELVTCPRALEQL